MEQKGLIESEMGIDRQRSQSPILQAHAQRLARNAKGNGKLVPLSTAVGRVLKALELI
jgi:hypothetical protein